MQTNSVESLSIMTLSCENHSLTPKPFPGDNIHSQSRQKKLNHKNVKGDRRKSTII